MRGGAAALLLFVLACVGGSGASQIPTPVGAFRPEDRVVIGDFSQVNALAAATDRLYVVYPTALAIWKPLEQRWEVPRAPRRPDVLRSVTRAVVDPLDRSLWLAAGSAWIHYDPIANRWDEGVMAVPPARLPRTSTTVEDAMRDLPQLRTLAPTIATGPLLTRGAITAAARDPMGNGWFLGTSTRGLVFFDRMATDVQPMSLGLRGDLVGAIALTADGVWVATENDGLHPASLAHLATELDVSSAVTGTAARGLPFNQVRQLLVTSDGVWLATDQGAVHVPRASDRIDRFSATNGLGDGRVLSLALYRGRVVAGTMRGLSESHGDSGFVSMAPSFADPVYSLRANGDTLWIGTVRGLFALLPGSDEPRMSDGFRLLAGSSAAILGIGYVGDTLVAMTPSQLLWRDPRSGGWTVGPDIAHHIGSLVALEPTANGAWVGGTNGAAFVRGNGTVLQMMLVPGDLPGGVTSVATRGRYLWIGTRAGLVRFLLTN